MRKYVYILIGGAAGAPLRVVLRSLQVWEHSGGIPVNTLAVNIIGSFILAFFLTIAFEVSKFDADVRLGVSTGFLGAFTTFSTLSKETALLIYSGDYVPAFSYVLLSGILGLSAVYLGVVLARELIAGRSKNRA
jgi:CrcB protein